MSGSSGRGTARRVIVVTGGGGGIGAAVAEELGRRGVFVVTVDPLVSIDGAEQLPAPEETTAGRIEAAGGAARASAVSVTDRDGVRALFEELAEEFGRLDGVVNVAGITRPTSFLRGSEDDWRSVLEVHLDGYRNVLDAALPIMAEAGHGCVLGVTSGSGWRAADTGAYGCAKRAVASLTWQVAMQAPPGVTVNAMSPIAMTRMVAAALGRRGNAGGRSGAATGGLSLGGLPEPSELGPAGAHLADGFSACRGQVLFVGGSEVAIIDPPRLLEVLRTDGTPADASVLDAVVPAAFAPAEDRQESAGGSNPRFGDAFDELLSARSGAAAVRSVALVSESPELRTAVRASLERRGSSVHDVEFGEGDAGFDVAAAALAAAADRGGDLGAVVIALAGPEAATEFGTGWRRTLAEHQGISSGIHADAGWVRAAADHAVARGRPMRIVTLSDATSAGGRSRAQASAQLARAARGATDDRVAAFAISVEGSDAPTLHGASEFSAHLLAHPDASALSGAELVASSGWVGLRSHPRPRASITFGGPELPDWFDGAVREIVGRALGGGEEQR